MPKSMIVDPAQIRKSGSIKIKDIPLNQYKADFSNEKKDLGEETLKNIYVHMRTIREFETALDNIKKTGIYSGITCNYKGPAHLSIGQEAAAVGQAVHLDAGDMVFGSHRSHGEILAKCFSAMEKMDEADLQKIMEQYFGGTILKTVEQLNSKSVKDLTADFILYGTLAEIFARETGFNKGLGGSMHAFFPPFGSMPNNAIVGGSCDIAVGAALFKRINRVPGIVIANIGDASMGCGPVWEGITFAGMAQFTTLWDKEIGGAPPVIINFFNNFYGMGGQTHGETMPFDFLARVGAGVNADNMHSERVDGYNPLAVADAIKRKKEIALKGLGPVLLDTLTYRISGHSPSDASSYRSKEEVELWENIDCVSSYAEYLKENGVYSDSEIKEIDSGIHERMKQIILLAIDEEKSPYVKSEILDGLMFSNQKAEKMDDREPEVLLAADKNPRVKSLARKSRRGIDENGNKVSQSKVFAYRDALFEAMLHRFYIDPTMAAWGEENRDWGGAFAVYRGLTEALPYHRLFNSPISEGAIAGTGAGYALSGGRAVVELMYCDFLGRAGDEVFNQIAKWQAMSAGLLKMPLTLRISIGNKYGAQHSQDWASMVAHVPGLKAMYPATPYDAKGMLNLALSGTDPVIFFESQKLYGIGELFRKDGVPEGYYEVPEGEPNAVRTGNDLTIITLGPALYTALDAAEKLEQDYGLQAEVIDLRFINPLNLEPVADSVKRTGKAVLISEAVERGNFMHNVASNITQLAFDYLDAPPAVVGARNWISPAAEMEAEFFPQSEWIIDTIHERIIPLPGRKVQTIQTYGEIIRKSRRGV